jgi:hypothetical protein
MGNRPVRAPKSVWSETMVLKMMMTLMVITYPEGSRRLGLPDFKTIGT